jgi:hypothetical protein
VPGEPPLAPVVLAGAVEVLDTELLLPAHVNAKTTRIAAMINDPAEDPSFIADPITELPTLTLIWVVRERHQLLRG